MPNPSEPAPQPNPSNTTIPTHVAIIMDGNSRWAIQKDLSYIEGHREAIQRIREIIERAAELGVKYLTLWAWSNKNWKRNKKFIHDILNLFRENLKSDGFIQEALDKGAELNLIGSLERFPTDIAKKVKNYLKQKPTATKIIVNLAVGYEGRDELLRVIKKMIKEGIKAAEVNIELVNQFLDTSGQPDVDFLIRTGGEKRTSGYLIWQAADAEYYFTDTYMPDFTVQEFQKALDDYAQRERRMGGDSKFY